MGAREPGAKGTGRALVLNATFEPLGVVSTRRALLLVLGTKAELVHAKELASRGTPVSAVYDAIIRGGRIAPDPRRVRIDLPAGAPSRGDPSAPIVIQEFADFQCPYCMRAEEAITRLLTRYPKLVRLVWRDLPLSMHLHAELAAEAAAEAKKQKGDSGFWAMHDKMFANQQKLDRATLDKLAGDVGLDMGKYKEAMDKEAGKERIKRDMDDATKFGARGTPNFFINGRNLRGAQPVESFKAVIDEEIKKADAKIAGGTPRGQLQRTP